MNFAKIEYPTCPECKVLLNDDKIFDLWDLRSTQFFHKKTCPCCKKPFLMKTRIELQTEVVGVEE